MDAVTFAFRQLLGTAGAEITTGPREMLGWLMQTAQTALGITEGVVAGMMSARFERLLGRWLTRAVNYAIWVTYGEAGSKKDIDGMVEMMKNVALKQGTEAGRSG